MTLEVLRRVRTFPANLVLCLVASSGAMLPGAAPAWAQEDVTAQEAAVPAELLGPKELRALVASVALYYYRIILRPCDNASGGRYDHVINGNMIAGFAMVAWPADYGSSGVMMSIVSHNGRIHQKNIGEDTEVAAAAIQDYNPDGSWSEVKD